MNWSPLKGSSSKYVINQFVSHTEYTTSLTKTRKLTDFYYVFAERYKWKRYKY